MEPERTGALSGGRISYIFILVHDLPAMLAFYRDILGFRVHYAEADRFAFLSLGGAPQIALYPGRTADAEARGNWFFVIDVDDIDAAAARLSGMGVAVSGITDVPNGRA